MANMSFIAICSNKIQAKISEFTVLSDGIVNHTEPDLSSLI